MWPISATHSSVTSVGNTADCVVSDVVDGSVVENNKATVVLGGGGVEDNEAIVVVLGSGVLEDKRGHSCCFLVVVVLITTRLQLFLVVVW